jgi:hypothetical protein
MSGAAAMELFATERVVPRHVPLPLHPKPEMFDC